MARKIDHEARLAKYKDMPDAQFIRAVISGSRYLDSVSTANAREALRRMDRLHPEAAPVGRRNKAI